MPIVSEAPRERVPAGESLLVLTRDAALAGTLKALGPEHTLVTVGAEADLAGELLSKHIGVAILDVGAAASPIERLTERLKSQFPDLVLIVAGRLDDQTALTAQITTGVVYRFLHKPLSEQRVRLFVEAAWRRHDEALAGETPPDPMGGVPLDEPPPFVRNAVWLGAAILALLLIAGGWLMTRKSTHPATSRVDASTSAVRDDQLEDLLARADRALATGILTPPATNNAADLYQRALNRNSTDTRAAEGLERVIDRLLSAAEVQLTAQHLEDAQRLTDQARAIKPDHVRVAFLTTRIGKERERQVLSRVRQAAASGNIAQALSVLDSAAKVDKRSALVAEVRAELQQKQLDEQVNDLLGKASECLNRGQLAEPAQENAVFFIESARALAPSRPEVQQAEKQLREALVMQARTALAAGNPESARHWIDIASESGVGRGEITELTREAQRVQTTAKADAMARLALLFNQRLAQGQVIDPPADSAKFYVNQLMQFDATHPSTLLARQALATRILEEADAAVRRQDYASADRWLAEAREAGNDEASISAIEHRMSVAQEAARRESDVVNAGMLQLAHYSPPVFPIAARARGLNGWVDLEFLVKSNGAVADVIIMGAEPVGIFEQAALDAIRRWRYKPVQRDGHAVEQHARLRMKFTLDK